MSTTSDKIIEKIRNLIKLAEDGKDDEESQTALLMAQRLMLRYKVSQHDLEESSDQEITLRSLSVYKRLYWWERALAQVIADNFSVMLYVQSNQFPHQRSIQRKIVFMGLEEDTEFAFNMYHLVADSMRYYASLHVQQDDTNQSDAEVRKAYYQGFIDGLEEKFKQQQEQMRQENDRYSLALQTPKKVKEAYDKQVKGMISFKTPNLDIESQAYNDGFQKGQNVTLGAERLSNGSERSYVR